MSLIDTFVVGLVLGWFLWACIKHAKKSIHLENIEYRRAEVAEEIRFYAKLANETHDRQAEACYRYRLDQLRFRYRELEEESWKLTNDK